MKTSLISLMLLAGPLSAQTVDTLPATKVTVEAIRGTANTPVTQTTLNKADLSDKNYGQDMPYLLSTTPSITVASDNGSQNGYMYMRLRGMDQTRINMTLNGVPLNEPEDQGAYFSNFPDFTSSVRSVQVQRGIGTSSNGTASYIGSVNFESINPFESQRAIEFSPKFMTAGEWTQRFGQSAAYIRHTAQTAAGYRDHSDNESQSTFLSTLSVWNNSSFRITGFEGTSNNQMAYLAAPLDEIHKNPRFNPLSSEETDHFAQNFVSAEYSRLLSDRATTSIVGYRNALQGHYGVLLNDTLYDFGVHSGWTGMLLNYRYVYPRVRIDVGANANAYRRYHDSHDPMGAELYQNYGNKSEGSIFTKMDVALGSHLNIVGDVQERSTAFEYVPVHNAGDQSVQKRWTFFNPKVGFAYHPNEIHRVYGSFGYNTREPSRSDLFAGADNLSNDDLHGDILDRVTPETVRDIEIGYEFRHPMGSVHTNLYDMDFHDEIAPIGTLSALGLPLRKNIDHSYRRGFEVEAIRALSRTVAVSGNATISRNRLREYHDDVLNTTFTNVKPYLSPERIGNLQITYTPTSRLNLFVAKRFVGESQLDNTGNNAFVNPSAMLTDMGASVKSTHWSVSMRVINLFNALTYSGGYTDGTQPYYFVQTNRTISINSRINF